ncbi:MAG: radical SAM protein [Oscillospiraceae bacterium]|nr:radical SAM protein [Oscillospiraceae bacterium]
MKYLFWRMQIVLLRKCPPLSGAIAKVSLGAANSRRVWLKTLGLVALQLPRVFVQHLRNQLAGRVVLPRVTMPTTTLCTLHCDKCVGHIPDLTNRRHFSAEEIISNMQALFARVDYIYSTIFTGGELFLHPQLDEILWACASIGKTDEISVQSNATVMPNAKVLDALKETNTAVKITQYSPTLQPRVEEFKQLLQAHSIRYTHESAQYWADMGAFGQQQPGDAEKRYRVCTQSMCMLYAQGKFHPCTKSFVYVLEDKVSIPNDDFIHVPETTRETFAPQWNALMKKRRLTACSYCLGNSYESPRIPVGVQRKREET